MSGEALTTHVSLTMDLILQLFGRHMHNGDAPMRELVDEFRARRAGDLGGLRLGELSLRVPKQRCCDVHLLDELGRRQAKRRERSVRYVPERPAHSCKRVANSSDRQRCWSVGT